METNDSLVTVFGATGYLGRHVVRHLSQQGYRVRAAARHLRPDLFELNSTAVEQIEADVTDTTSVAAAVRGANGVVNTVGLYVEKGAATFDAVHVRGAGCVASNSTVAGARLVHISGIGVDAESPSPYIKARAIGEQRVREAAPDAVILRPSALFGPGDAFLRSLFNLVYALPVVPLFGSGRTRLQPVFVDDVANAVSAALDRTDTKGKVYELGGPEIYTYRGLLQTLATYAHKKRGFFPVPFLVWDMQAVLASLLPNPPLTRDQVALMRVDNVVGAKALGFTDLAIEPRALQDLLPQCLKI